MPPPDVPLLISTSVSPVMRAITFVNTPLPGAIVIVSARQHVTAPKYQANALLILMLLLCIILRGVIIPYPRIFQKSKIHFS